MTDETNETPAENTDDEAGLSGPRDAETPDTSTVPDEALAIVARERDEFRDLLLRKTAELDNYRKRADRERIERDQSAAADLLGDLLPLVDDLDRALDADASTATAESYRQGVDLIRQQLLDLLGKRGVEAIEALGTDFDPHVHQAVATETSEGHRDGEVLDELRRGYMLRGRLLRAAMVRVAKA